MRIGNSAISKLYLGSDEILKAYLGAQVVYEPASGGFVPTDLSNIKVIYDFTDSDGMTLDVDGRVTQLNEENDGSFFIKNNTGSNEPVFSTNKTVFSNDFLERDNDLSYVDLFSIGVDFHIFFMFKLNSNKEQTLFATSSIAGDERFAISYRANTINVGIYDGSSWLYTPATNFTDTTLVHKLEVKYFSGVLTAFLDGVQMNGTQIPYNVTGNRFRFGHFNSSYYIEADLYEFISTETEIVGVELNNLEAYFDTKYAGLLPSP